MLVIGLSFIDITDAFRAFTKTSFASTNLTVQCVGALSYDIACSPAVAGLRLGEYYSEDTLTRTCTSDCGEALEEYAKKVASACEKQTWNGYEDTVMPLAIIPDMLRYHYNLTCLMDSGRYCNTVAGESAARLESEGIELKVLSEYSVMGRYFMRAGLTFNPQRIRASLEDRWALTIQLVPKTLLTLVIYAPSRIFISKPAHHISMVPSSRSDLSTNLRLRVVV